MSTQVSFKTTNEEYMLVLGIVKRAKTLAIANGLAFIPIDVEMDLCACHANGCKLNLEALLEADDANFGHDVFGISKHIDRETGELTNCFLPRFAAR